MIGSSVAGALPRTQELIAKTRSFDRGRITESELESAFREATQVVVKGQTDAGLTRINGGMLRRQDLLRPFSAGLGGVEVGPMLRWFNNNTFFKAPIVKGEIKWKGTVTSDETYIDLLPKGISLKAVLPAPYTLAHLSHDTHYKDQAKLMKAYAVALNSEAKELEKKGFSEIQFSDPALVYMTTRPKSGGLRSIAEAVEIATSGLKSKTVLQTFFGDAKPILKEAAAWAIDGVGVDLYETDPSSLKGLKVGVLSLGVVDARNSVIEDPAELAKLVTAVQKSADAKGIVVSTNSDMDFLTWDKAEEKIKALAKAAAELR